MELHLLHTPSKCLDLKKNGKEEIRNCVQSEHVVLTWNVGRVRMHSRKLKVSFIRISFSSAEKSILIDEPKESVDVIRTA